MTPEQESTCNLWIHGASVAASGAAAGIAQLPLADNVVLAGIIGTLTLRLTCLFKSIEDAPGEAVKMGITSSALASGAFGVAAGAAEILASAIGKALIRHYIATFAFRSAFSAWMGGFPFIGNAFNALTAGALVEFLGWQIAKKLDGGDPILLNIIDTAIKVNKVVNVSDIIKK